MNISAIPVAQQTADKFYGNGDARPYPGNTILTSLDQDDPAHQHLVDLSHALRAAPGAEAHSFLPDTSYHMTLFRGANDRLRMPGDWPACVALDAPMDDVTALFAKRLRDVVLPDAFAMRPVRLGLNPTGEIQLTLEGANSRESDKLSAARAALMAAMDHRRRGDDNYRFHITFSYRSRPTDSARQKRLAGAFEPLFMQLVRNVPTVKMRNPAFCTFQDMLHFEPVRLLARSGD